MKDRDPKDEAIKASLWRRPAKDACMGQAPKYILIGDYVQCYKSCGASSAIFELGARLKPQEEHKITPQIGIGETEL